MLVRQQTYDQAVRYGLIAEWHLADASGREETGIYPATYTGSPTFTASSGLSGNPRTAMTLNGTTQYASASPATGTVTTVVLWFRRNRNSTTEDLCDTGIDGIAVRLDGASNQVFCGKQESGFFMNSSPTTIADSAWHFLVVVFDGAGTGKIYLDARDVTNLTSTGSPIASTSLRIGTNYAAGSKFQGELARMRLYNRILVQAEISLLYRLGRGF